jgi:hypothetical protein
MTKPFLPTTEEEKAAYFAAWQKRERQRAWDRMLLAGMTTAELHEHLQYAWKEKRQVFANLPLTERIQAIVWKGAYGPDTDSTTRLEAILGLCHGQPPEVFWPAFTEAWTGCDDTWWWRVVLLDIMRSQATRHKVTPGMRQIWRGCSRARVRGISWTTDRTVAERFARGHRGIRVPNSVVAEAYVDETAVFAEIDGRSEHERLVDPRRLRRLVIHVPHKPSDGGIPAELEGGSHA